MASVGDIVAVAQLGYSLADALKGYVDEVGSAKSSIKALAIDIESASHRVEDLSKLIRANESTGFFTVTGLTECQKLSTDINETVTVLRKVLAKTNCSAFSPYQVEADEIDISKWKKFRWPLLKKGLAEPRARLGTLKVELQLLMTVASAHKL